MVPTSGSPAPLRSPASTPRVAVALIVPALNESLSLPLVLPAVPPGWVDVVVVVDNGSTDGTGDVARSLGAAVVTEEDRGYGAACLAGAAAVPDAGILVFMDGDASDDPADIPRLLAPLLAGHADVVIGSRTLGRREPGALLPQARWGNALAAALIRLLIGRRVSDLGPFRALSRRAWQRIAPDDRRYGFPVQTQVRALLLGLVVEEVAVGYRRRVGRSKISGTVRGVLGAGWGILSTILREWWRHRGAVRAAGRSGGAAD